ncbi:uncharacterized protein LOC136090059 [Hydra vulgaris]|uniref:Uncharacterized protein LOC136090059 n=1 Tax=Hydra vulgaris TaxID=6087 RepID=A0ABM4DCW1_HYDVU
MPDGDLSNEQNKIVNCLNKHFQDVFTIEEKGDLPPFYLELNNVIKFKDIEDDDISFELVLSKLKSLKDNKSPEADKLCSIVVKNCATPFTLPLTLIFRESLKTKSIIRERIEKHLDENNLLTIQQHGFVEGKSCTTNLLETLDFISSCNSDGIPVDVVMLDFAKAFDSVPHKRLFAKLNAYVINGIVLKWMEAFLNNRRQRIVLGEVVSEWVEIFSGVLQGSVIGTLNVISDECTSRLQRYLNTSFKWTEDWLLKFNVDKCVVMHYGVNNKKNPLYIIGIQLPESNSVKDLSVIFSKNLKWKDQVISVTNNAKRMLGQIKKSFERLDCHLLKSLYVTFIRPFLEFSVPNGQECGKCNSAKRIRLEVATTEQDLGIVLSSDLKFHDQVTKVSLKANRMLGTLKKTFLSRNLTIWSKLYKVYVRPHLEYVVSIWSPYLKNDINILEKIHKRASKIPHNLHNLNYSIR